MNHDTIIIGGGIGGLSTAALLAEKGKDVLLLEKRNKLGGRAKSSEYKPGFIVDWGIHLCRFGEDGEAAETLRRLGIDLKFKSPAKGYHFYEDGKLLGTLSGGLKIFSFSTIRPLLNLLFSIGNDLDDLLDMSVEDWVTDYSTDEKVRRIFWMLSTSLLISPFDKYDASMGELVRTLKRMIKAGEGGAYPVGGWKTIIDKLVQVVEEEGGEIRTDTEVEEIIIDNGTAKGVKINKSTITAENIVMGLRHQKINSLIKRKHLSDQYLEKCESLTPTAGISFDIGTSEIITDIKGLILSRQVPLLGMITSNIDPTVSPEGKQLMTFFFVHTPEEMENKDFVKQKINEYREILHNMFPDLEDNTEWERTMRIKCVDGAALTTGQHFKKRPDVETPIENLYFASDTCGVPGGGGDISFRAARKVADLIE